MSDLVEVQGLIHAVVTNVAGHALSKADLHDLVQETNLRVLTHTFDATRGSLHGWVSSIARNLAIDAIRRVYRQAIPDSDSLNTAEHNDHEQNVSLSIGSIDLTDPNAADVIEIITREQRLAKVQEVLDALHPDDLHFILISIKEDFDYESYAQKLGVTAVSLRVRKFRLGEKLRQMISKLDS